MQVHASILQRVADIAQHGVFLWRHHGGPGCFGQFGLEALGQTVDEAFELLHLGDERIAAFGQLMLDGCLDCIRPCFNNINTFSRIANGAFHPVNALVELLGDLPGLHENVDLAQQGRDNAPRHDRKRQAYIRQREDAVSGTASNGCVEKEQNKSHYVSTRIQPINVNS